MACHKNFGWDKREAAASFGKVGWWGHHCYHPFFLVHYNANFSITIHFHSVLGDCDFVTSTLGEFLHWAKSHDTDRFLLDCSCLNRKTVESSFPNPTVSPRIQQSEKATARQVRFLRPEFP